MHKTSLNSPFALDGNSRRAHDQFMAPRQLDLWTLPLAADGGGENRVTPSARERASRDLLVSEPAFASSHLQALSFDPLKALDARAQFYLDNARAARTRLAYARDVAAFERWCGPLGLVSMPASVSTLARYLTHLAESGRKMSTVRRARMAIGMAHADVGAPRPDQNPRIRTLERGMGRIYGTKEEGAYPLLIEHIERIVATLGDEARDDRDRVLLLLGFAGAFRGSELVAIRIEDISLRSSGLDVVVRCGKADSVGALEKVQIDRIRTKDLCAVEAVRRWLERLNEHRGSLLRSVAGERILEKPLQPRAISRAIQRLVARAGIRGEYSSHSLRAGLAATAHARGLSDREIQAHGRWRDRRSLDRYICGVAVTGRRNLIAALG
jgi:integrase